MNGDDYSYSLKLPRLSFMLPVGTSEGVMAIVSREGGTRVFFNGRLVSENQGLYLRILASRPPFLVLGNNCYGSSPWNGKIYGFAMFKRALSEEEILFHFKKWMEGHTFERLEAENPFILYPLGKFEGRSFNDLGQCGCALEVPRMFKTIFKKMDLLKGVYRWNVLDGFINFFGFMPLGFMSIITFLKRPGLLMAKAFLLGLFLCLGTSLFIETVQMWLPSRYADSRDIIFNTLGGIAGMCVFMLLRRKCPALLEKAFSSRPDLERQSHR